MGIEFICPVCNVKLNSRGEPFVSVRAIALHIAGKIKGKCPDHIIWAYEKRSQMEIDEAIAEAKATGGINALADLLLLPVKQWHDERNKPQIGFRKL
jgi:hypothetical protein